MHVIPSIDTDDIQSFSDQIRRLTPHYSRFHIDIADGALVPFKSVSLPEALKALEEFKKCDFDFHLMVKDPLTLFNQIEDSSLISQTKVIFIHHRIQPDPVLFANSDHPYELGLVINPDENIDTIKQRYDLQNMPNIQIMSVNPGPQGSPFLKDTLNKIEHLRSAGYRNKIFLDGGVNEKSLKEILHKKFHPDYVCPGSYFSKAENISDRVQYLSKLLPHENHTDQDPQDNNAG